MSTNLLHHFFPQPSSSSSNPLPQPSSSAIPPPEEMGSSVIPDPEDDVPDEENIFRDMTFDEILEDLNARFLVNLPKEESSLVRVYWQAEQAHWFYEDYLRPLNPLLPSMSQRNFTHLIIASSPLYSNLNSDDYDAVWEEYCRYKRMVPCCGGILFNTTGDKVLMVRGWKSNAGWCFPRGKINSEESEEACAIREVEEETGFDLTGRIVSKNRIQTQIAAQTVTMFLIGGIDESTIFQTQTRKEIGAIEWVHVSDLPTWSNKKGPKTTTNKGKKKFYNVTPFVGAMKKWLTAHGYQVHPKRRQAQPSPTDAGQRTLEPYHFDSSPMPSPQPIPGKYSPQPAQARDATALDNLFHRFVHKQEQSREEDALAKLLGGLSTTTPAPRAPEVAASDKASKPPSIIDAPAPIPSADPPKPHQASLLAMLSPQQDQSKATNPVRPTDTLLPNQGKPISLPTSPRPPSPAQEERTRKQRALLEQITAGIGIDVSHNLPLHNKQPVSQSGSHAYPAAQPGSQAVSRDRSRDSSVVSVQHARQSSIQRITPNEPFLPPLPTQRGSGQGHSPTKNPSSSKAPPPPYDSLTGVGLPHGPIQSQVPHAPHHQGILPQFLPPLPMTSGPPHPSQSMLTSGPPSENLPRFDYRPQPVAPPQQQQNLLNLLRSGQPPAAPNQGVRPVQGPMQGYRPHPQLFSPPQQGPMPPGPPFHPHVQSHGGQPNLYSMNPPHPSNSQHPLPVRPQSHMLNPVTQQNHTFPSQGIPASNLGRPMGHHHDPISPQHDPAHHGGFGVGNVSIPPTSHGTGPQGKGTGVPIPLLGGNGNPISQTVYHHPVPRPPNSQAGTLLSMLNDDPLAEARDPTEEKKKWYYASDHKQKK